MAQPNIRLLPLRYHYRTLWAVSINKTMKNEGKLIYIENGTTSPIIKKQAIPHRERGRFYTKTAVWQKRQYPLNIVSVFCYFVNMSTEK